MQEIDKNRILNFLIRKESVSNFESWVYNKSDLEARLGSKLYFERMMRELLHLNEEDNFIIIGKKNDKLY